MSTEVVTRARQQQIEGSQALKTALELSMLNISSNSVGMANTDPHAVEYMSQSSLDDDPCALPKASRSQNITHCVAVPSSEHVAEIVGRQGKAS